MRTLKHNHTKSEDFDTSFDQGDVTEYIDLKSAKARYPVQSNERNQDDLSDLEPS